MKQYGKFDLRPKCGWCQSTNMNEETYTCKDCGTTNGKQDLVTVSTKTKIRVVEITKDIEERKVNNKIKAKQNNMIKSNILQEPIELICELPGCNNKFNCEQRKTKFRKYCSVECYHKSRQGISPYKVGTRVLR